MDIQWIYHQPLHDFFSNVRHWDFSENFTPDLALVAAPLFGDRSKLVNGTCFCWENLVPSVCLVYVHTTVDIPTVHQQKNISIL
jgi:hypothetical protein